MALSSTLGRKRQEDLCKFEVILVYITSFRTARGMSENLSK